MSNTTDNRIEPLTITFKDTGDAMQCLLALVGVLGLSLDDLKGCPPHALDIVKYNIRHTGSWILDTVKFIMEAQ